MNFWIFDSKVATYDLSFKCMHLRIWDNFREKNAPTVLKGKKKGRSKQEIYRKENRK